MRCGVVGVDLMGVLWYIKYTTKRRDSKMNRYSLYASSEKGRRRSRKYKANNVKKVKAQNIALYAHPVAKPCSAFGCDKMGERHHYNYDQPKNIIWLCRDHHNIMHGKIKKPCSIEGCLSSATSKGLCKKHYAKKYRTIQGW